jgi:hypothetical protein
VVGEYTQSVEHQDGSHSVLLNPSGVYMPWTMLSKVGVVSVTGAAVLLSLFMTVFFLLGRGIH